MKSSRVTVAIVAAQGHPEDFISEKPGMGSPALRCDELPDRAIFVRQARASYLPRQPPHFPFHLQRGGSPLSQHVARRIAQSMAE